MNLIAKNKMVKKNINKIIIISPAIPRVPTAAAVNTFSSMKIDGVINSSRYLYTKNNKIYSIFITFYTIVQCKL